MNNIINRVWNRGTMVNIEDLRGSLYQNEQLGHTFVISGVDGDGNVVSLSGTVDGAFLRPDNTTVAISGSASGGKAYVTLPANCYDVPGKCGLTIYLTADSQKTALYAAVVTVTRTSSDTASPGTTASVVDLVNAINAAISQIPATDTALKAAMAPTYSNTGLYAVGSYAWYNGVLKRCIVPITTAESYTAAHWTDAALGNDLRDLKSAFNNYKAIIGGTYTFDDISKGWSTLQYSIKAGKAYKIKNIGTNNIAPIYSKTGDTNIETIVDAETNLEPNSETTFTAQNDADGISAYFKGNSGDRGLQVYQIDTFVEDAVVQEQRKNDIASVFACMTNESEAFANSTLLGTSSFTDTYWSAIPNDLVYSQTGVLEFELANDADSVFLSLNQTNSSSTRLATLLNNIPMKAGKYRFIFLRTSNTNYVEMRINGSVPSVTLSYYDTDKNHIAEQIKSGGVVRSSDYSTKLPDLNSATDNTAYVLYVSTSGYPANLPVAITGYSQMLVVTYRGTSTYKVQVVYNGGIEYTRVKNGSGWTAWESFRDYIPHYYKVDSSYTDGTMDNDGNILYSSLAKAIEEAVKYPNSTVKVNAGTYNIISEYQTLHPDDWDTRNDGRGINLNNGIKLIFSSKAVVECKYTGDDTSVMTNFSAFNVRFGNAEIINANIDASNVRYCVHDDMFSSATPYHVRYADCIMKIDNSGNTERSKFPRCIGGGFGQNAHIDIENCVFEGIGGNGTTNPAPDDNAIVDWHNGPNASQKSNLFMTGCFFKGNGTFAVSSNGTATEKSQIIVSGNSFGSELIVREPESGKPVNIEVYAFNNEVRTE